MAEQPIRVMFRFNAGTSYRLASEEEKQQTRQLLKDILLKWKSSGVKLVGAFSQFGDGSEGYSHYTIFETDSVRKVGEMNGDVFGSDMLYDHHSFEIGALGSIGRIWNEE